jgi:hypothetical protein
MIPLTREVFEIIWWFSLGLWAITLALLILGCVWQHAWKWVDDSDEVNAHPLWALGGWEKTGMVGRYKNKQTGESKDFEDTMAFIFFLGLPVLMVLGSLVVVLLHFYAVPLTIGVLVLVAHLSRFGRRHKKLFDKHVNDPKAHVTTKED